MDLTFSPPLYQLVEAFFARARAGARRPGGTRARAKMLRPIDKGADIRLNNGLNPGTRPTAWARSKFIQSSIK